MLTKRDTGKIYLYQLVTLGLYFIYWCARSGQEVNHKLGRKAVPTAWWLIVPFGAFWWMWQYSMALDSLSSRRIKQSDTFLLFVIVGFVWEFVLDEIHSLPTDIVKLFLPHTLVDIGAVVLSYLTVILAFGFFCANVQNKLNNQTV